MTNREPRLVRHPLVARMLHVLRSERLTPHMQRIVVGGDALRGFLTAAPDDHVKLFFPNRAGRIVMPTLGPDGPVFPEGEEPSPMRDYTPRRYDEARGELTIDFVLHGDGPASSWAAQAAPGQALGLGGPRGSMVVAADFDAYVLAGDETALPAIGRWLEEMPAGTRVEAFIELPSAEDRQALHTQADVHIHWLERSGAPGARLEAAVREHAPAAGDVYYWIATESRRARALRRFLAEDRGIAKEWLKATGYWKLDGGDD